MKKLDFLVCAAVVLTGVCLLFFAGGKGQGSQIEIQVDGKLHSVYSLSENTDVQISTAYGENTVRIQNGKASVVHSSCKDKIEINAGEISRCGESLICLPNRLVITVSGEGGVDGVSY